MKENSTLIGKKKNEILKILGDQFNIPFSKTWCYEYRYNFYKVKILILYFDNEETCFKINIQYKFKIFF